MAKYKKADNCGPVGYPDQSGRYLGDGEVAEDDADNNWAPLVALGFVVETGASVTPDVKESPAEMVAAVEPPPMEPPPMEAVPEVAPVESAPKTKSKRSKRKKKEGVENVKGSSDDGAGAEEVDSSKAWESDS